MNSHSFWWLQLFLAAIPFKRFPAASNCQIHSSPHQSYLFQHPIASREQTRREGKHDPCKALFICRSVPSSSCNLRGNLLSGTNAPGQSTGLSWQSQLVHNLCCLNLQMPLHLYMCLMMHPRSREKSGINFIVPPQKLQRNRNAQFSFLAPESERIKEKKKSTRYKHKIKISPFQLPPPKSA